MKSEPSIEMVVDGFLFFELSGREAINEDAADGMLEQIAATLQRLEPEDKSRFLDCLKHRSTRAQSERERQTLENLASNMGPLPE